MHEKFRRRGKGFTLVELLIVIAIVGILLSLAISTYTTNHIRSQITEALVVAQFYQKRMEQYYAETQSFPTAAQLGIPASGTQFTAPLPVRKAVSMFVAPFSGPIPAGHLTIHYNQALGTPGDLAVSLIVTFANGTFSWSCGIHPSSGANFAATSSIDYMPGGCQQRNVIPAGDS